jgi:hypothetical protein
MTVRSAETSRIAGNAGTEADQKFAGTTTSRPDDGLEPGFSQAGRHVSHEVGTRLRLSEGKGR